MKLVILDVILTVFHLIIIGFNLLGWIWEPTRKIHFGFAMITLFCWLVLGIWFGLGYCPITEWQWDVKVSLGEKNLPASFIKYFVDRLIGVNLNPILVDICTVLFFLLAIIASIKVNFFNKRVKLQ